jgi:3-methylfumaryl-CoA hydratase
MNPSFCGLLTMSFDALKDWLGRTEAVADTATAAPLKGLAATLDHADPPWPDGEVPPLGHWLYFLPQALQSAIGEDGHPRRGGFLPPVPLPRRMWAGGRLTFHGPVRVGEPIRRLSTIAGVEHKHGKSGDLVFVNLTHEVSTSASVAITEQQDLVYREAAPGSGGAAAPAAAAPEVRVADWSRTVVPDPVLLFRYSALTFNGHRIHYDRAYAQGVEGYPALVVHGPLIATLLVDLFLRRHPGARITSFAFRGRSPLFDSHPFVLCGKDRAGGAELWALDHAQRAGMTAEIEAS